MRVWGTKIFILVSLGVPPKNTIFIKMGESPSVFREYLHTGRLLKRIDYSIFKKSNAMSFQWKKNKNFKLEKNSISQQSKNW